MPLVLSPIHALSPTAPGDEMNVTCSDGDLRLVNGFSHLEGRVEICFYNTWGTICARYQSNWDSGEANVACRQLGFIPRGKDYISCSIFLHQNNKL